jgi:hypothetical protein
MSQAYGWAKNRDFTAPHFQRYRATAYAAPYSFWLAIISLTNIDMLNPYFRIFFKRVC